MMPAGNNVSYVTADKVVNIKICPNPKGCRLPAWLSIV